MHQITHSASPYLYKIVIDNNYKLTGADINKFKKVVSQGIAVYGFTPNIIIVSNKPYSYWGSIALFAEVMDTGKLALCSNDDLQEIVNNISSEFAAIKIKLFGNKDIKYCKEWAVS